MRASIPLALLAAALVTSGCPWIRRSPPRDTAPPVSASTTFESELRPLLEQRCGRCHFPGGRMHERLPFDDEATVRMLGREKLFTRIEDEDGRRIVDAFFGQPAH
jgi:hypothetical protein